MIVLSTLPNAKSANKLAKELIESKAAACVNCIPNISSFYKWENKTQKDSEIMMMIKGKYKKIRHIIEKNHPYEIPQIIAFKPNEIGKKYKKWIKNSLIEPAKLVSTRSKIDRDAESMSLSKALLNPTADNGGLYAPINLPALSHKFFSNHKDKSYEEIALKIIKKFNFDISENIFKKALETYSKFDKTAVEIKAINENLFINELWHGPTRAFKDMALQPFGVILKELAMIEKKKYLIMCATSGDTGPATLETFKDSKNIKVVCLYPENGTSEVQRLQMVEQTAENLKIIGIKGNFDDAQTALKHLLADDKFKSELSLHGLNLSAANSVNFGRILFQILYHIFACIKISQNKKTIDIIIPSGNFGNGLGAYYAKKMGANIGHIKIASNSNDILTEFFNSGVYDLRDKKLIQTISPAMDILISSNVERLLFDKFGGKRTAELMQSLKNDSFYKLTKSELNSLKEDFVSKSCSDKECETYIKEFANKKNILLDPHTATCLTLAEKTKLTLITSTAHWVKFTPSMVKSIKNRDCKDELSDMLALSKEFNEKIPSSILDLFSKEEIHKEVVKEKDIKNTIIKWINK